jgi:hypothetical protein
VSFNDSCCCELNPGEKKKYLRLNAEDSTGGTEVCASEDAVKKIFGYTAE